VPPGVKLLRVISTQSTKEGRINIPIADSTLGEKTLKVIRDGDRIVDYQNVRFSGYLSTFKHVTPQDRQGDYVEAGAFRDTIPSFMRNPVLLCDHLNSVAKLVGRFTRVFEDGNGLFVEAEISNGQVDYLRQVRALVAEGHLRTLSMGGVFYYKADGRGIQRVDLLEGTLTPMPANPDAIISVIE
jgi:HK97 family phage prohead protease